MIDRSQLLSCNLICPLNRLDGATRKYYPYRVALGISRENINLLDADAEGSALECVFTEIVLQKM